MYASTPYKHDRLEIESAMQRILRESVPIKGLRERLILQVKARDRVGAKKTIMHINKIKQDETYGREIS